MNQELAQNTRPPGKVSALAAMANRIHVDPEKLLGTLKATVFQKASNEELLALVAVANEYNLNPLTKEIYAFPAKGGGIVPVVSIDGWVSMVNDHPQMDGLTFEEINEESGNLSAVTCRIYRKDRSHPIEVTEHLSECRRNTEPWKMERRMLRHKALIQCARYAFGFSGITDEDEAENTPGLRNVTPSKSEPRVQPIDPTARPEGAKESESKPAEKSEPKGDDQGGDDEEGPEMMNGKEVLL